MKRLTLLVAGLALVGGIAAGCSKTPDPVATPSGAVDANAIAGNAQKCASLATSYGTLFAPLASPGTATDADRTKVKKALDDMKSSVSDSVKKDLDTISNGIANAKDMTAVATFMTSADFTKANTNVTTFLATDCAKAVK